MLRAFKSLLWLSVVTVTLLPLTAIGKVRVLSAIIRFMQKSGCLKSYITERLKCTRCGNWLCFALPEARFIGYFPAVSASINSLVSIFYFFYILNNRIFLSTIYICTILSILIFSIFSLSFCITIFPKLRDKDAYCW